MHKLRFCVGAHNEGNSPVEVIQQMKRLTADNFLKVCRLHIYYRVFFYAQISK